MHLHEQRLGVILEDSLYRLFRFHRGLDEVIFGARTGLGHVTPPA
jgi:hypothetical protein